MRHGPVIPLLLVVLTTLATAAEQGTLVRGPVNRSARGSERVENERLPLAGPQNRETATRTLASKQATHRPFFADLDLLDERQIKPIVRSLASRQPIAPAQEHNWFDLRPNATKSTAPRTESRDAPWTPDHLLANATSMNDAYCSLAVSPTTGDLYAVFEAVDLGGTDRDIHIARSQDDGATWTVWDMPSFTADETMPDIAIDDAGFIHVVWIRDDGYITRSRSANADDPTSWAWIKGLFTDSINATPSVAVTGSGDFSTLFIVASYQEINWDLYAWEWTLVWMWSTNSGNTVSFDSLVPDSYPDLWPDVALDGALAHIINGEADVYGGPTRILISSDAVSGGFNDITDLTDWTTNNCGFPKVACADGEVFAVFQHDWDDGLGNIDGDIIYSFSWDSGTTMYGPYEIIADEYESVGPAIYQRDGIVGCLWLDAVPGGDEFDIAARQGGGHGHPDNWGDVETVTDQTLAEPQYRYLDGAVGNGLLHAAWIDRRDTPTQGHNVYTCERATEPDLSPFTPTGWGGPLVGSMYAGDRELGFLAADRRAFISFAFMNDGLADITADFRIELLVDTVPVAAWELSGGLPVSTYVAIEDHELILGAGDHVIAFDVDTLREVAESDETDNTLSETWTWIVGDPELRVEPSEVTHEFDAPPSQSTLDRLASDPPTRRLTHLDPIGASLRAAMSKASQDGLSVVIEPSLRIDTHALDIALTGAGRADRRATTIAALRANLARAGDELAPVFNSLISGLQMDPPHELWLAGAYAATIKPEAVAALAADPAVGRVWLDDRLSRAHGDTAPTDPDVQAQALAWQLTRSGVDQAWSEGFDGNGVLVGHVDSGVSYDHPDLAGSMWDGGAEFPNHGWDAVDDDDDPYDGDMSIQHGTHTAGLIIGDGTSGTTTGAAPGATLMALRAIPGYFTDLVEAMQFGLDHGPVDVISMSAGWDNPADDLKQANRANADVLMAMGIPWIVSAGNGDGYGGHFPLPQDIGSPADCPNPWYGAGGHSSVISVGATTSSDVVWSSSSIGPTRWDIAGTDYDDYPYPPGLMKPDVAAPGDGITSTLSSSGYVAYSGTSMSCPLVAGAVAILLQASPGASPALIAETLEIGAVDIDIPGRDNSAGAGLLNIPAALDTIPAMGVETFTVHNDGVLPLNITSVSWAAGWLDVTPTSGRIDPGMTLMMRATFDPAGMPTGLHTDDIVIASDDPNSPHDVLARLVIGDITSVGDTPSPMTARLSNHPNPFNPRTTLSFDLAQTGRVELGVYDLQGRRVRVLVSEMLPAGRHEVMWDGLDNRGRALSSGLYFARALLPDGSTAARKLTLVR